MILNRQQRHRSLSGAVIAALAFGGSVIGIPALGSVPVAQAAALQTIPLEAVGSGEVALGALASRSQRGPVTIGGIGPYTITGTDSLTNDPYTFVTDAEYNSAFESAYGYESVQRPGNTITTSSATGVTFDGRTGVTELRSSGGCEGPNLEGDFETYCAVFGPEVYSAPFAATVGQAVSFDWSAVQEEDDYEIYAYLVEVTETGTPGVFDYGTPATHKQLTYGRGANQTWITASGDIPNNGTYRFRFVNGTYDATGGQAVGSVMYIDGVVRVGLANPITFPQPGDKVLGSGDVTLTATSVSPGPAVNYQSITTGVCTVSGSTVTLVSDGVCSIIANQPGDGVDYVPAASATRSFSVLLTATAPTNNGLPLIQGDVADGGIATGTEGTWGDGGSSINNITTEWRSNGTAIPGVTGANCVLVADPSSTLSYSVTETNAIGSTTATSAALVGYSCTAAAAPVWTDQVLPSFVVGVAVADGVAASGLPEPTYSVTAGTLPAGLVLDPVTGAIVGTPTASGRYDFSISAVNGVGSPIVTQFTGSVAPKPAAPAPTVVITPGLPGGPIVVTGGGFNPGSTVQIVIGGVVTTTTADDDGNISVEVQPPAGDEDYEIEVRGTDADGTDVTIRRQVLGDFDGNPVVVPEGSGYQPLTPDRVLDTRPANNGSGKVGARQTQRLSIDSGWNVPTTATALVLNVTAVAPDVGGYLTVYSCDTERPLASVLNYDAGRNVPNLVVVSTGDVGDICIYSYEQTHLVVDLNGYFGPDLVDRLATQTPQRLLDTRTAGTKVPAGTVVEVQVTGEGLAPVGSVAAVMNAAVVQADADGFLTIFPCGEEMPTASNVNYQQRRATANHVIVKLSEAGSVCVFSSETAHVVLDLNGSFEATADPQFIATTPVRVLDSRTGAGVKVGAGETVALDLARQNGVTGAAAVALNVTVARPDGTGFITVYPCGGPLPLASNVNFVLGDTIANHATATVGDDGKVCLFSSNSTHLVVDVEGVYV